MQFVEENKDARIIGLPMDRIRVDELDSPVNRNNRHGGMREMIANAFGIRFRDGHEAEYSSYGDEIDGEENDEYEDLLELDEDIIDPVPE